MADVQVLAGLRHHALVGRDHEQHGVDAAGAGQHVLHEALVAGHVHERERSLAVDPMGEAEIDGDPARLFFLEPIGIDAGQRKNQTALAVIDVTGGADDEMRHGWGQVLKPRIIHDVALGSHRE